MKTEHSKNSQYVIRRNNTVPENTVFGDIYRTWDKKITFLHDSRFRTPNQVF